MNLNFTRQLYTAVAKSSRENDSMWLPVWMHSIDAAGIIKLLLDNWLPENVVLLLEKECGGRERLVSVLLFCALNHDLGKLTCLFQVKISTVMSDSMFTELIKLPCLSCFYDADKSPHAVAGEVILHSFGCPDEIASIIGSHHGKPTDDDIEYQLDKRDGFTQNYYGSLSEKTFWRSMWDEWIDFSLSVCGLESLDELQRISQPAQVIICGLLIMADWIASNTSYFPLIPCYECGSFDVYPDRVESAWKKLSLPEPWHSNAYFGMDNDGFAARFGFAPNSLQSEILDITGDADKPGIYILEAPMGIGKTEAALSAAEILAAKYGSGGVFFGMPTQATSNGIFVRLEDWAKKNADEEKTLHSIRLAHAAAELNDDYHDLVSGDSVMYDEDGSGLVVHSGLSGRKQALLSDFVIGTVDQMLLAALKQKHVMLRHLGLAGKVVIVDECHAYDAYMNCYLDRVMTWLGVYKVPVIILSATLPSERRKEMVEAYLGHKSSCDASWMHSLDYPQLIYTTGDSVMQKALSYNAPSKKITLRKITEDTVSEQILQAAECGGCVGVIVNTVRKAQKLAETLRLQCPSARVIMIHAQFLMPERAKRERLILNQIGKLSSTYTRCGLIVIGTQVLEQSLDIDFDLLITELCPMDLLIQRVGRLHRHSRIRPNGFTTPTCMVIDTVDETTDSGSRAVYGDWLLLKTSALLKDSLTIPDDIPVLVQKTYDFHDLSMFDTVTDAIEQAREDHELAVKKQKRKAGNYLLSEPEFEDTFFGTPTLDGWLRDSDLNRDASAEKAVRDGDPSIDVIALFRNKEGQVCVLSSDYVTVIPTDRPPSHEEARLIARQKLRLPSYYGKKWMIDDVVRELENATREGFAAWRDSPLLKEELVLLFDETMTAHICGTTLHYDLEYGLKYEKGEENGD